MPAVAKVVYKVVERGVYIIASNKGGRISISISKLFRHRSRGRQEDAGGRQDAAAAASSLYRRRIVIARFVAVSLADIGILLCSRFIDPSQASDRVYVVDLNWEGHRN